MTIREVTDGAIWNRFITGLPRATFLHSWQWGQLQQREGEQVRYLGFFEDETQRGAALVITVNAKRGRHYLCPHGPLFLTEEKTRAALPLLIEHLRKRARQDNAVALRVAPLLVNAPENRQIFAEYGFRPAPLHVHAELTWELDISKPEEQLLQEMRKTSRHAIKKAAAAGVTTSVLTGHQALARFMPLYEQTHQRHGFVPFTREFIAAQLELFGQDNSIFTVIAQKDERDLAGAIIIHYGTTAYYYHGASVTGAALPAAHAVQWAGIKEAKRRDATHYNFWGIAPDDAQQHPFAGITVFKKGFGGAAFDYMHAQDLPLSFGYWKLWLVEMLRKYRRGF